ncbi:MAG: ABC transporter permease [Chloroflexi bacterium]|nr:ABC transporter permease [Chloroflexota bacterium]
MAASVESVLPARAARPRPGALARFTRRWLGNRLTVVGGTITVLLVVVAIIGPSLAPMSPTEIDLRAKLTPPGLMPAAGSTVVHPLGTDQLGRDTLSRMLYAAQVTVVVAALAVVLSTLFGVTLGIVSGYFGGWVDMLLMRAVDIQLAFPMLLLAITVIAVFGTGIPILVFVFVLAGWVRYVRVIRAQTLVLKEAQFVEAARAVGASHWNILRRHVSPNLLTEIIILVNLEIGRIILVESSLSYLGLGVQPPMPTWGNMLNEGRLYLQTAWWVVTFPGAAIMLTVLGVNLLAEGLRSIYDPRMRR